MAKKLRSHSPVKESAKNVARAFAAHRIFAAAVNCEAVLLNSVTDIAAAQAQSPRNCAPHLPSSPRRSASRCRWPLGAAERASGCASCGTSFGSSGSPRVRRCPASREATTQCQRSGARAHAGAPCAARKRAKAAARPPLSESLERRRISGP